MYYLRTEQSFDAAHFLKGYEGKCSNIHGHRWRVIAEIEGEALEMEGQQRGMLIDFGVFKELLGKLCDAFDHSLVYESGSLRKETREALQIEGFRLNEVSFRPTAEHLAEYFFDMLKNENLPVHRVEVYETPNNFAAYEEKR